MTAEKTPLLFDELKIAHYTGIAMDVLPELDLHIERGLLGENGRGWENIPRHELHVTARVVTLTQLLGLSPEIRQKSKVASSVHDLSKRDEKGSLQPGQSVTWEWYDKIASSEISYLRSKGYDEDTIRLAGSMGHSAIEEANLLLDRADQGESLSEVDIAFLSINYVDGFTINDTDVNPADFDQNGILVNELDRRSEKGKNNPSLKQLEQDGLKRFGIPTSEAMRQVGHRIENYLVKELSKKLGVNIDPLRLPEFIDNQLKLSITNS